MSPLAAAILGLVQALTEFLPVSSSGHLVIAQALLGVKTEGGAAFEVAVHFGTLLSVALLFRRDLLALAASALGACRAIAALRRPGRLRAAWQTDPQLRLLAALAVGCVPAGVVGILFKDQLEAAFGSVKLVGAALLFTGVVLLLTRLAPKGDKAVGLGAAALIGVAQAVAILPGISRAGSTIATALFLKVEPEAAARFSFLMSLPVVAGATLLKARDLLHAPPGAEAVTAMAIGAAVSFTFGMLALWLIMAVVRRGWFAHFGWYCLAVGGVALALA